MKSVCVKAEKRTHLRSIGLRRAGGKGKGKAKGKGKGQQEGKGCMWGKSKRKLTGERMGMRGGKN